MDARASRIEAIIAKHQGPGPHKSTGTPQSVHGGKNEPAHEPLKPRETTGEYTSTGGTSEATAWVRRAVRTAGGFTVNRMTGEMPKEGIAVAHPPQHSLVLSLKDLSDSKKVDRWLKRKRAMLSQPNTYLGGWLDKSSKKVYIDVVEVFPPDQKEAAIAAGRKRNQLAVFDLGSFEEIPTGGTGKVEKAAEKPELMLMPGDIEADALTEALRRALNED